MFDIEGPLRNILQELIGMRSDLKEGFAALAKEVGAVNANLADIRRENQERFAALHPEQELQAGHHRKHGRR